MKESIEIPFGAKDSELCGWEYTIPKGFVASIENGKIIVKKDDDRDEKIRKALIENFKWFGGDVLETSKWGKDDDLLVTDILAWLEKQGEQNLANSAKNCKDEKKPKFRVGDTIKCKYDDRQFTIKSVDLDKGTYTYTQEGCGNDIDYADEAFELVKQNPAWSEEDETALCDALWCCKQVTSIAKDENDMGNIWYAEKWLKSLKERIKGDKL